MPSQLNCPGLFIDICDGLVSILESKKKTNLVIETVNNLSQVHKTLHMWNMAQP